MFLKRCPRRKCGKEHVYWQLVESVWTPRGSRHRVAAYLGGLSESERRGWARLAATLDGKAAGKAKRIWVFDRGIVSESNLEFLRDRSGLYLVGPAALAAGRSRAR